MPSLTQSKLLLICAFFSGFSPLFGVNINESARDIPVSFDVDVAVIGGSSAGVAAAIEAANAGASVLLTSEQPYPGWDVAGSYRLWLEDGQIPSSPLAQAIFAEPEIPTQLAEFSYTSDIASVYPHEDTDPPGRLKDGIWFSSASQSVQYNGSVNITADLGTVQSFFKLHTRVYQGSTYKVQDVTVYASTDNDNWNQIAFINNDWLNEGDYTNEALNLSVDVNGSARYLKFYIRKTSSVSRILVGEIQIEQNATLFNDSDFIGGPDFDCTDAITPYNYGTDVGYYRPKRTVNGEGLDAAGLLHDRSDQYNSAMVNPGSSVPSENGNPAGTAGSAWFMWNFNDLYSLTDIWVWNYCGPYRDRGLKNITIDYFNTSGWHRLGSYTLNQGATDGPMAHTDIITAGIDASRILITADETDGNYGGSYYGLSEIRFFAQAGSETEAVRLPPTAFQVKRVLEHAMLDAGVEFMFGTYPTDVLYDSAGEPAGVVVANRSGRQAVKAKTIIDATQLAAVTRMTAAEFDDFPAGMQNFSQIVIADQNTSDAGTQGTLKDGKVLSDRNFFSAVKYSVSVNMADNSYPSYALAEQQALDLTWTQWQKGSSDILFNIPPDAVTANSYVSGEWPGAAAIDLDVFRPAGISHLYLLGACAAIDRTAAEQMLNPLEYMQLGTRIGAAAAADALARPQMLGVNLPGDIDTNAENGEVYERLLGHRPTKQRIYETIPAAAKALPVLAEYDVVVVGGGTGGAPAAIAAAREGADTLLIEYLHGLGGVGTEGHISKYWYGNKVGYTAEIDAALITPSGGGWDVEEKKQWLRNEIRQAGGDIWFGAIGCGAVIDGPQIKGIVAATPLGRGIVLCKTVIDGTGNGDIAIAAGAPVMYTDTDDASMQGTGLPPVHLGVNYRNSDFTVTDVADPADTTQLFVYAKDRYIDENPFDMGQLVDARERRRIAGEFTMSVMDQLMGRTYPDTIAKTYTDYDNHGYNISSFFYLCGNPPHTYSYVPYRCMLPQNVEGILVAGIGISVLHDALPIVRMQPDIQNQGYAAGIAAAMAAGENITPRQIDVEQLQAKLVQKGIITAQTAAHTDPYPLSAAQVQTAVDNMPLTFPDSHEETAIILAHPETAWPMLKTAYDNSTGNAKLAYAQTLAVFGDDYGLSTLADYVSANPWDTGHPRPTSKMSDMDRKIISLGVPGNNSVTGVIANKADQLDAESDFSHIRAVALALEYIGDPAAAEALAGLLNRCRRQDNTVLTIQDAIELNLQSLDSQFGDSSNFDYYSRILSDREIILAKALVACGDWQGLGQTVLQAYSNDLRGVFYQDVHDETDVSGDISGDEAVDIRDLFFIADYWLSGFTHIPEDFDKDGFVNFHDLTSLSRYWN
ncbi:putative FAD-binding dehydrogenase [Limihaloglobus sulfuriphilus]|uniref:Putative FAD-binding dehydrogenase n=1 Tax=Limihaloglobus sulfuriphilus TaxID=1851148 RepID=A0A1Q2MAM2_9BACT|nr:FAD-dependent oxidoreductase [Limihaloglobus sulfuriphilus]AQQ69710.1 putative FAD-binding dehydrogenase [Limihaloglobus sulfuriphilus]